MLKKSPGDASLRNNRISAAQFLNRCCAFTAALESMLLEVAQTFFNGIGHELKGSWRERRGCWRDDFCDGGNTKRRNDVMGEIVFENDPPYKRLNAQSAQAIPTSDGVELVLSVSVEGPTTATVPFGFS